ncbi:MAG: transaldolase [Candidatus Magasanikbacteria bacterium CG_4_10_14_0_2_um_filter_33_14]|uniref:Transaldolase n=1 Tax=Candidatus Magasanikbacteria bacterium CG_4_10_14_0_2_um_filter_33_14 TaxID=1974636 RepID=A0A2M7VB05_9BACT|nr:MAG: transaldolase [Candidatus Magasanikbacteria bacterium CG_4_10_14_0_2_um_filter_33_14]
MRPQNLKTKIFLDSGNPVETREAIKLLGFLDGQTTNPSLIAKNPELQAKISAGEKLSSEDVNTFYKGVVEEIQVMIPDGSISIEVYADKNTLREKIMEQAREMNTWIPNAHIKLPITGAGLLAEHDLSKEGIKVNMTLCFAEEQAAAVYNMSTGTNKGDVFVSPFIGRLDDKQENGMSLIENIQKIYSKGDGHVELLAASIRSYEHFLACLALEVDIITAPLKILEEWWKRDKEIPDSNFVYDKKDLKDIEFKDIALDKNFIDYNLQHDLTDAGLEKFVSDWDSLTQKKADL